MFLSLQLNLISFNSKPQVWGTAFFKIFFSHTISWCKLCRHGSDGFMFEVWSSPPISLLTYQFFNFYGPSEALINFLTLSFGFPICKMRLILSDMIGVLMSWYKVSKVSQKSQCSINNSSHLPETLSLLDFQDTILSWLSSYLMSAPFQCLCWISISLTSSCWRAQGLSSSLWMLTLCISSSLWFWIASISWQLPNW